MIDWLHMHIHNFRALPTLYVYAGSMHTPPKLFPQSAPGGIGASSPGGVVSLTGLPTVTQASWSESEVQVGNAGTPENEVVASAMKARTGVLTICSAKVTVTLTWALSQLSSPSPHWTWVTWLCTNANAVSVAVNTGAAVATSAWLAVGAALTVAVGFRRCEVLLQQFVSCIARERVSATLTSAEQDQAPPPEERKGGEWKSRAS
jgi:hypothetical protein